MPRFKINPTDQSRSSAEITALDGAAILHIIDRIKCEEADILEDDVYSFSVRLAANGLWTIFKRPYGVGGGRHPVVRMTCPAD